MAIRDYHPEDRAACLAVFRSNTPDYFTDDEVAEFETFLDTMTDPYFVLELEGQIMACGGVFVRRDGQTAGLAWGMVHRAQHRQGYGRALLDRRLTWLGVHAPHVTAVTIETSQHSAPFFARLGFNTTRIQPEGFALGLDQHDMRLSLSS
ncbi:GNAT family N-acetyltransferase [Deinococcus oregonensis]|uniref:GNAT family N-acetyltransferase n=1 Tax=Deinococcus oregonensis TaxID=1805970 RepID=A0ABV6B077_9DEIO